MSLVLVLAIICALHNASLATIVMKYCARQNINNNLKVNIQNLFTVKLLFADIPQTLIAEFRCGFEKNPREKHAIHQNYLKSVPPENGHLYNSLALINQELAIP